MENLGKKLEGAYKLLNSGKANEAKKIFDDIYLIYKDEKSENLDVNYVSCLEGLGCFYMEKREYEKSLKYYEEGNDFTKGKDFNILFNMGVIYTNLGDEENAKIFIDKAKEIKPKDSNLLRFIEETSNRNSGDFNNNIGDDDIDEIFLEKVQSMIDKLK